LQQQPFRDSANSTLKVLTPEKSQNFPNLSEAVGQRALLRCAEDFGANVIVFDTLTRCFRFDTNDVDAWLTVNDFLITLRSKGYCVIVVHHAGKWESFLHGINRVLQFRVRVTRAVQQPRAVAGELRFLLSRSCSSSGSTLSSLF